jgi:type IV pilus assembly protein PilV
MLTRKKSHLQGYRKQSGLSLLESLVALVVLAIGILGLAGVQTRLLVETRTANSRAIAVQLIDDLTNRMALNRYAALGRPQTIPAIASSYTFVWSSDAAGGIGIPMPANNLFDCSTNLCTPTQLAGSDIFQWRRAVYAALPGAQATVFQNTATTATTGDHRQLGIAIAWPLNEAQVKDNVAGSDASKYNSPFDITTNMNGVACPNNLICHLVYVQP